MANSAKNLEKNFEQAVIYASQRARLLYGFNAEGFIKSFEKYGAAAYFKQQLERKRLSTMFTFLGDNGGEGLELTPEALATDKRFTVLFTDEQVDFCLEMLLEYGFYERGR